MVITWCGGINEIAHKEEQRVKIQFNSINAFVNMKDIPIGVCTVNGIQLVQNGFVHSSYQNFCEKVVRLILRVNCMFRLACLQ